jgi:hypothetical protein
MPTTAAPAELDQLLHPPLIPEALARRHDVHVPADNRFKAAARLLASLWRSDRDLPAGSFVGQDGKRHKVGSLLTQADGRRGANFVNGDIARLAMHELYNREPGSSWDADRLRRNLLSSQTMCLNVFGPLRLDLDLATAVTSELLPDFIGEVVDVIFEHNPRRGHPALTGDFSALDVLIRAKTPTGGRLLVGVEVKYSETCHEGSARIDKRHIEIAQSSGSFIDPHDPTLRENPCQQLFRLTNLLQAMVDNDLGEEALLLFVAPAMNSSAQAAVAQFQTHLAEPKPGTVAFMPFTLEQVLEAIGTAGATALHDALHARYTDFHQVAGELDLYADEFLGGEPPSRDAPTILLPPPAKQLLPPPPAAG